VITNEMRFYFRILGLVVFVSPVRSRGNVDFQA